MIAVRLVVDVRLVMQQHQHAEHLVVVDQRREQGRAEPELRQPPIVGAGAWQIGQLGHQQRALTREDLSDFKKWMGK